MRSDCPGGIRVLHVDDDPAFLEVAAAYLARSHEDLVVESVTGAGAALDYLADNDEVDCVVSDFDMPGTNGLQLLSAVREEHPDLPFVLFTGKGSEEIASEAISAGVTDYVQKETGTDQYAILANRVANVVEASRSEAVLRRTEERYRTLVDSSPVPIMVYDARGTIVRANAPVAAIMGADEPAALVGTDALALVHPAEREEARRGVRQVLEEGRQIPTTERRFVGLDGTVRDVILASAPVPFGDETAGQVVMQEVTAYKDRQADLESTGNLLSTLVENIPLSVVAEDRERRVLVTNRQFCDLFDLAADPEELVGEDCVSGTHAIKDRFVEPDRFVETTNRVVEARTGERREEFDLVDGRTVERSATPVTLDGDETGLLWVYHDVTERKRSAHRFRTLFENLPDPAVIVELTDGDAVTRAVNGAFESVFGYDEAAALGTSINDLIVPGTWDEEARQIDASARSGEQVVREVRRLTADGELRDFLFRNVLIELTTDEPMAHGIYTDITGRKRRERRLNALHEATRHLMATETGAEIAEIGTDAAEDVLALPLNGIHLYDPDADALVPVAVSPQTYDVIGEPPPIGRGEGIAWEVYETGEPVVHRDVRDVGNVLNPETPIRSELFLPLGEHGVFLAGSLEPDDFEPADVALAKVLSANVEAALDQAARESALRRRETELARQNRRLEEFANVVSHDLKNPLSIAEGHLSLARETGEAGSFVAVERAHDRMARLIDDLLTLARQGRAIGATEPVTIDSLARRAWSNIDVGDAALDLRTELSVDADGDRLVQLFENLFRNSVAHSSTGSQASPDDSVEHSSTGSQASPGVTVRVGSLPDEAGFYVEDDGPGIPAADRERVFESGFSTASKGTGFGLAIVSTIVEAHGWTIRVRGGSDGGARFEVVTGTDASQ